MGKCEVLNIKSQYSFCTLIILHKTGDSTDMDHFCLVPNILRLSRYEIFYAIPIKADVIDVTPTRGFFCTRGHNLNKLGRYCIPNIRSAVDHW